MPLLSKDFDITKHLYRRDFLCDDIGATAIVKWSKTLQSFTQWTLISVLLLTSSTLCPVQAFKVMTSLIPASPNHSVCFTSWSAPPSQVSVRNFLANILSRLDLDPTTHTFHCFTHSGAFLPLIIIFHFSPLKFTGHGHLMLCIVISQLIFFTNSFCGFQFPTPPTFYLIWLFGGLLFILLICNNMVFLQF